MELLNRIPIVELALLTMGILCSCAFMAFILPQMSEPKVKFNSNDLITGKITNVYQDIAVVKIQGQIIPAKINWNDNPNIKIGHTWKLSEIGNELWLIHKIDSVLK